MQNLRDKLLQAGLVSPEDAKKVEAEKNQPRPPPARPRDDDPARRAVSRPPPRPSMGARPAPREEVIPKLPPLAGSKAHQRLEALKLRELADKLRELVRKGEVPNELGSRPFHFVTRKGRLRRMDLSEAQALLLEQGKLAVVERQEPAQIEHSLVPAEVAEQMMALLAKSVRFFNKEGAPVGFLTETELKDQQAAEAAAEPEGSAPSAPPTDRKDEPKTAETWIAIKRSP